MALRDEINRQRDAVLQSPHGMALSNVRLFGSVARGDERPDSDVDLLIDFDTDRGFDDYLLTLGGTLSSWPGLTRPSMSSRC